MPSSIAGFRPYASQVWARPRPSSILLAFGSEEMDNAGSEEHDDLRHEGVLDEEECVEKYRVVRRDVEAVDVVEGHGGEGQAECAMCPWEVPSARLPGLDEAQA